MPQTYRSLLMLAMPQAIMLVTALVTLMMDALLRGRSVRTRFSVAAGIASLGCAVAGVRLMLVPVHAAAAEGVLVGTPLSSLLQIALLVLTVVALLLATESEFTEHVGEFVLLVLMATTGMLFLVGTQNLLVIFIALEILSLSLYALTGVDKRSPLSSEAALKYFLFGGMSAAFLLFGFSLLYGMTNSIDLAQIGAAVAGQGLNPLLVVTMVMVAIGLGFKVAAAPFHFWTPDVYQSAPGPVAGFIASASKVASFYVFYGVMVVGFAPVAGSVAWGHGSAGWAPMLAGLAALSMVVGNLGALVQSSVRRLMAYSAIAHAGYMLVALVAHSGMSLAALLYYVMTYSLSTLGTFAVIAGVERQTGSDSLESFNGLGRRSPVQAMCLFVFLLSQAGIPPLAGFFGKFFVFVSALRSEPGLLWLVVLAIGMSAVSLYYYLQVLKRVYVREPAEMPTAPVAWTVTIVTVGLAVAVVVLGCAPQVLLQWIEA